MANQVDDLGEAEGGALSWLENFAFMRAAAYAWRLGALMSGK
ncbi:Uncharacterized protein ChrSV_2029 [Chromobacterium vaccinii]|nr:Uncharacterized protein ChrSW_2029 [Chromobacterium vaccinii]QND89487.1 Uncharacterized protein ChrSV_2029 [Chromobacterium vaccinii]